MQETIPDKPLPFLRYVVRPYRAKFMVFCVLSAIGISCFVATPFVVADIINDLTAHGTVERIVWILVGLFVLLRFVDEWAWRIAENYVRNFMPDLRENVRSALFTSTLRKKHSFFVNANSGQIGLD